MNFKNLDDALNYVNKFQFHGFRLGLDRIEAILTFLGSPHKKFPCIHIAGTNGKGSICATLATIFKKAGISTGLYTSPHLLKLNERFVVDLEMINDEELKILIEKIATCVEAGFELSYFEFTTALAFEFFAQKKVNIAIIETGLGGRLDATNVVDAKVCAITNISLEHQSYLGDSIEKIAWEKAGIIKPMSKVVLGNVNDRAQKVILSVAKEKKAEVCQYGKDFFIQHTNITQDKFTFKTKTRKITDLTYGLFGEHQLENAAVALEVCCKLSESGIIKELDEKSIRSGLKEVSWPGRSEILTGNCTVFLEGVHNDAGVNAFIKQIKQLYQNLRPEKTFLLWACSNEGNDKDFASMLKKVIEKVGPFNKVIITEPKGPRRPVTIDEWMQMDLGDHNHLFDFIQDLKNALNSLIPYLQSKDDLLIVAGSLYLVGPCRQFFLDMGFKPGNPYKKIKSN